MFALPPVDLDQTILVTASLESVEAADSSDSSSVIDPKVVERLDEPRFVSLLRLFPSVALAETGPPGSQAQLRIRGAEANHTLLFVDGIKANDPASGNEARFELLGGALGDRIELTRGPQSSLWGADAIGGVVALTSETPDRGTDAALSGEVGTAGFRRADARIAVGGTKGGFVAAFGTQRSDGIDSLGRGGDRDGYRLSNARLSGRYALTSGIDFLLSGFATNGRSDFDGYDPVTFLRADTDEQSEGRMAAGRAALNVRDLLLDRASLSMSYLDSTNVNFAGGSEANRTAGDRLTLGSQVAEDVEIGSGRLTLIAALDHERETYDASDTIYGGMTAQNVSRERTGVVGEARLAAGAFRADAALRHDAFSDFADATSFSAGALVDVGGGWSLVANYGEGIAQPTFQDLYGFFPSSFVGNPALTPERSSGGDVGLRFTSDKITASALIFRQTLSDEILATYDFATFLTSAENGSAKSVRNGVELDARWSPSTAFNLSANYSFLDAGDAVRRPEHRAALIADGTVGRLTYGAALSYTGARDDIDYDLYPAKRERLKSYTLLSARMALQVTDTVTATLRATNLTDADYQDVVGYDTMGRTIHAGLRITG